MDVRLNSSDACSCSMFFMNEKEDRRMKKRSIQVTLIALLAATLVLPTFVFAGQQKSSSSSPSVQDEQCFVRVETTAPKTKKDISNNEVSCNKVRWGVNGTPVAGAKASVTTATYTLSKNDCVDERGRFGSIKSQRDGKTGQSSKTCAVQQFARSTITPSQKPQK
jgi:hypothetical protein